MVERLKVSIENKFGKKIACQKDCKLLSSNILQVSKEYISPATLRRLFGFLVTNSNPSSVTLDILCRYVGYKNWEIFNELNRGSDVNQHQHLESWRIVLEKSRKISSNTLDIVKRKSGINFSKTIERQFLEERISSLLNSEFNSTALIGPGGYGKSIMLAKWVEKTQSKRVYANDIVIFIQATTLNSIANTEAYFEDWLMRQLGLSIGNNFLSSIKSSSDVPLGRFILILDALDEANLHSSKQEKVYSLLTNFILKYSKLKWFKIIISSRLHAWNKFISFIENRDDWFQIEPSNFSLDGANIPLLTSYEIQKILDNTVNDCFPKKTIIDELSLELQETLSYPYFLQLFTTIFHPDNEYLLNDQIEIFKEFLNQQVYNASHSEEKVDIINKLLELSDNGLNLSNVRKNSLKEIYPIHLKLAGNYYAAYEELLSFGIIIEDDIESKYGGYNKIVRIANSNLFEILIILGYLEKVEDISNSLFFEFERKYEGSEILPRLIIRLYQFSYKNRFLKPLMSFFDLKTQTLNTVLSDPAIAISLRKDDYLRKHLLPIYASIPLARKYFFEDYPDFNNITGSFAESIDYYLKHYDTDDEEMVGLILNVYSGFLSMDEGKVERFYSQLKDFNPSNQFNPNIAGKWYACKILHTYFLKKQNVDNLISAGADYLKSIRTAKDYKHGAFESSFYSALLITNQFMSLAKLIKEEEILNLPASNKGIKLFGYINKIFLGNQLKKVDIIEIDLLLSQLNPMDSFLFKILGQLLKAFYYLNSNEIVYAYECYRNSTELSNLAGYKIIEVKLMKNLAAVLLQLGEKTKSIECGSFAHGLTKKTGFNYDLF